MRKYIKHLLILLLLFSIAIVAYGASAPQITSLSYDGNAKKLTLTIKSNGNDEVDVLIDGEYECTVDKFDSSGTQTLVINNIEYKGSTYAVTNINLKRYADNPNKVRISWDEPTSNIKVTVEGKDRSSYKYVNIYHANKTVTMIKSDGSEKQLGSQTNNNYIDTTIGPSGELIWDSTLKITSKKIGGLISKTSTVSKDIVNNIVYNPTIINDGYNTKIMLGEGQATAIDVKANDIHDPAWPIPLLKSVTLIKGNITAEIFDAANLAHNLGMSGLVIQASSAPGYIGETISYSDISSNPNLDYYDIGKNLVIMQYTYENVAANIPAASGKVKVTIDVYNEQPLAYDFSLAETASWGIFNSGSIIEIPENYITSKCSDRETNTADLTISRVLNCSAGVISIVPGYSGNVIRIDLTSSTSFYGVLNFQYYVNDGTDNSLIPGNVQLTIEKAPSEPIPHDTEVSMQLDEITRSISLSISNPENVDYVLKEISDVRLNGKLSSQGFTLRIESAINENGKQIPYIVIAQNSESSLKDGDVVTFNYTISYNIGTQKTKTAKIKVNITSADDPNDMEGYLYVHRRPLAFFGPIILTENDRIYRCTIGDAQEFSYDLDHQFMHARKNPIKGNTATGYVGATRPYYSWNGLRAWEWGIKTLNSSWTIQVGEGKTEQITTKDGWTAGQWRTKVFDAEGVPAKSENEKDKGKETSYGTADAARSAGLAWIQEQVTSLIRATNGTETIIVSLRVRDIDNDNTIGVWSDQMTVTLTGIKMKPVANFSLDNSTYYVPTTGSFNMEIRDHSYDPNGDAIGKWDWVLSTSGGDELLRVSRTKDDPSGIHLIPESFAETISNYVRNNEWESTPRFTITLVVTEDTPDLLESDPFSYTFTVYRDNTPPKIDPTDPSEPDKEPDLDPDNPNPKDNPEWNNKLKHNNTFLFEEDLAKDGVKGDTKGTVGSAYLGTPEWGKLFKVTDSTLLDSTGRVNIDVDWTFTGNSVTKRISWNDMNAVSVEKMYNKKPGLDTSGLPLPAFTNTVTQEGLVPGAYKIVAAITNHPSGPEYPPSASKTAYYQTYGDKKPYHMYVVPSLEIQTTVQVNDWEMTWNGNWVNTNRLETPGETNEQVDNVVKAYIDRLIGTSVTNDTRYDTGWIWHRMTDDHATLEQAGLGIEDVSPSLGDTIKLKVETNKYVTELFTQIPCKVIHPEDGHTPGRAVTQIVGEDYEVIEFIQVGTSDKGDRKYWECEFTLEDVADPSSEQFELTLLMLRIYGTTNWGSETEHFITRDKTIPVPLWILPVKLYDFRVTEVVDAALTQPFNEYVNTLKARGETLDNGTSTNGVLVHHLAVNSETISNRTDLSEMAKGYSFYFEVNSKGLKKDSDQIIITPRLYAINDDGSGNKSIVGQLVGYVPGQNGKYVPYMASSGLKINGQTVINSSIFSPDQYIADTYSLYYDGNKEHSLGNHNKIIINTDLRIGGDGTEQVWHGRYGIPANARFFLAGETDLTTNNEWKGTILVTFEIAAYKNGQSRYNYVEKRQWFKERNKFTDAEAVVTSNFAVWDKYDGSARGILNKNATKTTKENPIGGWQGTVILYNATKSLRDDYTSNPIWNE